MGGAPGTQQAQQQGAAQMAVDSVWVFLGRTLTLTLIIINGALALERVADHHASYDGTWCFLELEGEMHCWAAGGSVSRAI